MGIKGQGLPVADVAGDGAGVENLAADGEALPIGGGERAPTPVLSQGQQGRVEQGLVLRGAGRDLVESGQFGREAGLLADFHQHFRQLRPWQRSGQQCPQLLDFGAEFLRPERDNDPFSILIETDVLALDQQVLQ